MVITEPKSVNYAATVVALSSFVKLENCDNVKHTEIFGNMVIVGKDAKVGDVGIFFPVESQLSAAFLSANNLYRKPEHGNVDKTKKGLFESSGRVKAVKFRGHASAGFFVGLESLNFLKDKDTLSTPVGTVFDNMNGVEICRKYVIKLTSPTTGPRGTKVKLKLRIVDGQFRFHYDTSQLARNLQAVSPDSVVHISEKFHGTSAVLSNVLVERDMKWYEKLAAKLGVNVKVAEYALVASSRTVVKHIEGKMHNYGGYYKGHNIWETVLRENKDSIPKGFTVYGEIVGQLRTGAWIQKNYDYGTKEKEHAFYVYRVTFTNEDGDVFELPEPMMRMFCKENGFTPVVEMYYGNAFGVVEKYLESLKQENRHETAASMAFKTFGEQFFDAVKAMYVFEGPSRYCTNKVAEEGVVVRIDHLHSSEAYKAKAFMFLEHESRILDSGEVNVESEESNEG